MTSSFTIRKATLEDAGAIAEVLRSVEYFTNLSELPFSECCQRVTQHLQDCLADDSHSVYVALDEHQRVVGYISVHWLPYLFLPGPEGYISELFVHAWARGQGAGSQLLSAVKREAEARGCHRLSLINIRKRESYRRGFYRKDGWIEREDAANFVYTFERD